MASFLTLHQWLRWQSGMSWDIGWRDCYLFPADWIHAASGWKIDPGADYRHKYTSVEEGMKIVDDAGGVERFYGSVLEPLGLGRVQMPQDGDVGVIVNRLPMGGEQLVPAVCFGPLWSARTIDGVKTSRFQYTAVWRLGA